MVSIAERREAERLRTAPESVWSSPPDTVSMRARDVHVWRVSLDVERPALQHLWSILTPDEQARANRFRFSTDRTRFIAARAHLRGVLGLYAHEEPSQLKISYARHGKPYLPHRRLRFNISHSDRLALIAVADRREVGVDLERLRPRIDHESIAARFFAPAEVARLRAVPESMRHEAFLACWTRKEAYIKAKGGGLSIPLDQFEVSLAPDEPCRLVNVRWDQKEKARWSLIGLTPGAGYVGALCVEEREPLVRCWQWSYRDGLVSSMKAAG